MAETEKIETLIWYEMGHAKFWEQYLAGYSTHKLDYRKWYNITTMILSVVGAASFPLWKLIPESRAYYMPGIIFGLMAIAQILAIFQKNTVVDNDQLQDIIKLRGMYITYFNKMERLYVNTSEDRLTTDEAMNTYYQLRETTLPIEALKDSLNIHPKKSVLKKGEKSAQKYIEPRFLDT